MDKNGNDMIKGNIGKSILFFSIPLLGSSLIQQLYNTADMIFVGNFINKTAAAAVGASSLLFACLIGIFTGVAVGVNIVVSHKIGANNKKESEDAANTSIIFSFLGGTILTILGLIFSNKLLTIMNTPQEIMRESLIYLRIYFLSIIPMILYNVGSGILRASGNSKTPFYILIVGGIINIIANAFFIIFLKMGVAGVAIATFFSQTITAILIIKNLLSANDFIKINFSKIKISLKILKEILYLGLPAGIQSMVITFSNILVQYCINNYGENVVAAYAIYFKLENFLWMPIVAIGQATTTFCGQNTGANNFLRVKKGTLISTFISCSIAIIIAFIILVFPNFFLRIFIKDYDVINISKKIIFITFPLYWLYSILDTMGSSIRGMGKSFVTMLITMITLCGARIIFLIFVIHFKLNFEYVAYIYPTTWFIAACTFTVTFFYYIKTKLKFTNKNIS